LDLRAAADRLSVYQLAQDLNKLYTFGFIGITRRSSARLLFWPHRLREPHLIHGVHALAAMLFAREGVAVELHLDDTGIGPERADKLAVEFQDAVSSWFNACDVQPLPEIFRISDVLHENDVNDRNNIKAALWDLATEFFSAKNLAFDALVAAKIFDPAEAALTIPSGSARRLLSPIYTWFALGEALRRHDLLGSREGAITLGGADESTMWEVWRRAEQNAEVGHLLVPRLGSSRDGGNLWTQGQLLRNTPYRSADLTEFVLSHVPGADQEGVMEWLYTGGVLLARAAAAGAISPLEVKGSVIESWGEVMNALGRDPSEVPRSIARIIASWFYAETDTTRRDRSDPHLRDGMSA
jgi:hypothetical protein